MIGGIFIYKSSTDIQVHNRCTFMRTAHSRDNTPVEYNEQPCGVYGIFITVVYVGRVSPSHNAEIRYKIYCYNF